MRQVAPVVLMAIALMAPCQEQPAIRMTASEVMLDLVVRDKKQHFVRGLNVNDIQALEDGVPPCSKTGTFGTDGATPLIVAQPPRKLIRPSRKTERVTISSRI